MRRKIKIVNKTNYQTRHLRAFVVRVAKERFPENDNRALTVTFYRGRRSGYCSGWAYYNSGKSEIGIPQGPVDKIDLAHVIAHEFGHNLGLTHRDMKGSALYMRTGRWREIYAWAETMPLDTQVAVKKPVGSQLAELGVAKAESKLAEIDRKVKRLTTLRKKWARKLAYYKNRKAVLAASPPIVRKPRLLNLQDKISRFITLTLEAKGLYKGYSHEVYCDKEGNILSNEDGYDTWGGDTISLTQARRIACLGQTLDVRVQSRSDHDNWSNFLLAIPDTEAAIEAFINMQTGKSN